MQGPVQEDQQFSDVCRKLVAAVIDPEGWADALKAVAALAGGSGARLLRRLPAAPQEEAVLAVHAFDAGTAQRWLGDLLAASGAAHGASVVLRRSGPHVDALIVVGAEPFEAERLSWLALAAPHVRDALELSERSRGARPTVAIAAQMARKFPTPCALVDEAARCIDHSAAFQDVLKNLAGGLRGGRVVFEDPFLHDSWRQALFEAHTTALPQSLLANAASGRQWKVHVVPVGCTDALASDIERRLLWIVFDNAVVAPIHAKTMPADRPLTRAELEVLSSLMMGHTAKVIARARGASVNTVRSQITSILGKTGHHTQKELIASLGAGSFQAADVSTRGSAGRSASLM